MKRSRGAVLVVAIVLLSLVCLLMAEQAHLVILRVQQQKFEQRQCQTWLPEQAARERATLRGQLDPAYRGETWLPNVIAEHEDQQWEVTIYRAEAATESTDWEIDVHLRDKPTEP